MDNRRIEEAVGGLLPFGMWAGAGCWGLIGAWRAATEDNYAWNLCVPIAYGLVKGLLIGALAAALAGLAWHRAGARPGPVLAGALFGGAWCGTVADLRGAPQPLLYYLPPMADEQWYGRPLLIEWTTRTLLPALCCAVVLLLVTSADRPGRPVRLRDLDTVLLSALGPALLAFPGFAGDGLPEPEGNGDHLNEGVGPILLLWLLGLPVTVLAVGRIRRLRREGDRAPGGRADTRPRRSTGAQDHGRRPSVA
ncbi:hypothetical protein ACWEQL_00750 [Kitasatospora sp. NPDC004240]